MGKKEKKKGGKRRDDDKGDKKEDRPKGRNAPKKLHKGRNWKADKNDPIRKAVEADGSRTIVDMSADGNCLFRSLSDQLFADYGNKHAEVRADVCDYMESHENDFKVFLILDEDDEDAADFESYITSMREDGEWGGNLELVAAARCYRRSIVVFSDESAAFTIPHADNGAPVGSDLLLSYHDNDHYNSVRSNVTVPASNASAQLNPNDNNTKLGKEKKKVMKRSDPCTCGSGIPYKKCCLGKNKHETRLQKKKREMLLDAEHSLEEDFRVMAI